ncbi:NAD(+) diphosphatase [Colwellia sp. Bg11-12]|uniref:NAD(+) diphosphatase n=1 Tax=Colwellia sp. Bg11-12 TaxID=2759817 RepID=UPI0015F52210|nr:NAD(+) diphosphatase [Colwellia sp. Bg11-12]MBA6262421.1 NAD(+) diphosphatase [Colwellia sp. Bg11-12]
MSLTYANMPLDRCSNQRKDKRWLTSEFNHQKTLFCVINDGMGLFSHDDTFTPIYLNQSQLDNLTIESCIYLGKGTLGKESTSDEPTRSISLFTVDFEKLRFSTQAQLLNLGKWQKLREATPNLTVIDVSIQALAKALVYWHTTHLYCGKCGNANRSVYAGHARRCTECRNMSFPRTDPAVIMLVEHMFPDGIARCLLGRQASWKAGIYSTLAGFVDPGETLEEAVIREVLEETAVDVENPQYITSQPWPFPASVMLGFTAVATSTSIDISEDDLEDCQWFSREQLAEFYVGAHAPNKMGNITETTLDNNEEKHEYRTSSGDSISSYLITAWKNREIGQY